MPNGRRRRCQQEVIHAQWTPPGTGRAASPTRRSRTWWCAPGNRPRAAPHTGHPGHGSAAFPPFSWSPAAASRTLRSPARSCRACALGDDILRPPDRGRGAAVTCMMSIQPCRENPAREIWPLDPGQPGLPELGESPACDRHRAPALDRGPGCCHNEAIDGDQPRRPAHPRRLSDHDTLDLVDRHRVRCPVVELRRLRRRVPRDLLRVLKRPPVLQVRRDPRRPERVAARRGREPRGRRASLDHRQGDPTLERPARQPAPRPVDRLEERHLRLLEPGRLDVGVEGCRGPVVDRDVVPLPTLLVEPQPAPAPLPEVVPTPRSPARSCRASPRAAPGPGGPPGRRCRSSRGASSPPPARGPASPPW